MKFITEKMIKDFEKQLILEEKSASTVESYLRCVRSFSDWVKDKKRDKKTVIEYKEYLALKYKISTVNFNLSAINSFLSHSDMEKFKVKVYRTQREFFCSENIELSKDEYKRLLRTAYSKKNKRIYYIMQTICSTGIRVSELKFVSVEALDKKIMDVICKGKKRTVILPDSLCLLLKEYTINNGIREGSIFVTSKGNPVDRTVIWREMTALCEESGVKKEKVFPHNLRHLFARTYYQIEKDIVRLSDALGHSSLNTTRIYTTESGIIHRTNMQKTDLVFIM